MFIDILKMVIDGRDEAYYHSHNALLKLGSNTHPYSGNGKSKTHKSNVRKIKKHQRYRAHMKSIKK